MAESRRQSRADRRRSSGTPPTGEERRRGLPSEVRVWSQLIGGELQIFVLDAVGADNCAIAKRSIQEHLQNHPAASSVVFDLQKVPYIDTPGIAMLFELKKQLSQLGKTVCLQNPSRAVLRMLNITLLNRVFPVRYVGHEEERIPSSQPSSLRTSPENKS